MFDYDEIIKNLRDEGREEAASAIEKLLGQLYEAEEIASQFQSSSRPVDKKKFEIAARAYFDRRLIKPW